MNNDSQVSATKYLAPLFGIVCGIVASALFFSLFWGTAVLGAQVYSPILAIPVSLAVAIYTLQFWRGLLRKNKLFGWGSLVGFLAGTVIIICLIFMAVTVLISPA